MEGYIKFYAPVTSNTAIQLQQVVEQMLRQGLLRLHLLLSTPGGSVHDGLIEGLVTEIKSSLIPAGANLISIYDIPAQQGMGGIPAFRGFSIPEPQNFTSITNSYSSIYL